jgi:type IV pili sensor histidine kinase/response regulator
MSWLRLWGWRLRLSRQWRLERGLWSRHLDLQDDKSRLSRIHFLLPRDGDRANVAPIIKGALEQMIRYFTALTLLAMLTGCTTQNVPDVGPVIDLSRKPDILTPDLYSNGAALENDPVVRYGRYTLVSSAPTADQRDLMAQIIDISIPANMTPTVREAMVYILDRSGYSLCSKETGQVSVLYTRPLAAALYKIGPMTLRNALQVLAGPAWQVEVDEVGRKVCYVLRPGYQSPEQPLRRLTANLH